MGGWFPISLYKLSRVRTSPFTGPGNKPFFCYVDDLIEGFVRLMQQEPVVGPMNIGNPGEFTILELAEKVIALTNSASKIVYRPIPSDDPQQRKPDIEQAKQICFGWEPRCS